MCQKKDRHQHPKNQARFRVTSDSFFFAPLVTHWHSAAELWSKTFPSLTLPPPQKILGQITWQGLKNKIKQNKIIQQKKQQNECSESSQHSGSRMCISHEGQATTLWRRLSYAQRVSEYRQLWAKKANFVTKHPQQPKKGKKSLGKHFKRSSTSSYFVNKGLHKQLWLTILLPTAASALTRSNTKHKRAAAQF